MTDVPRKIGQAVIYAILAIAIGYFSNRPRIDAFPSDNAQVKLSFAHGSRRKEECRRLTSEEISKLPANERRPNTCGRERVPIKVQLLVDGKPIYDAVLQPTGLSRDGPARIYEKFRLAPGTHEVVVRLRDTSRAEGFDYEKREMIDLKPLQSIAIDFSGDQGTFTFR